MYQELEISMQVKYYFYAKLIQLPMHQSYLSKIVKKLLLIQKVYLIGPLKKVGQVFVILRIFLVKSGNFQKEFKVYQRENLKVS